MTVCDVGIGQVLQVQVQFGMFVRLRRYAHAHAHFFQPLVLTSNVCAHAHTRTQDEHSISRKNVGTCVCHTLSLSASLFLSHDIAASCRASVGPGAQGQ